jgi:transposase
MRGSDVRTGELFSYVDIEDRVPGNHPLRLIRRIVNDVLAALDGEFGKLYAAEGRPSIAPERLLRALLLQAFYTIRSERQLMEQLHYNLLYRWFVGLGVDDPVWVPTVFTKNRDRLLEADVARKFLAELLAHKEVRALLSDEHFSVDGTQVAAWASMKSFVAKDGSSEPPSSGRNGERDFRRETRSNATHASSTDPEAKLYKKGKGKEAKLSFIGNIMTENRNGFVVAADLRQASGTAERASASAMIVRYSPGNKRITVGADKASIPPNSWPTCATSTCRRTWRRTPPTAAPPSTAVPPAIAAMRSASRNASWLRSRSAGVRPSAAWRAQCCVACNGSPSSSH